MPPRYRISRKEHKPDGEEHCLRCHRPITWLYEITDSETGLTSGPLGSECVYQVTGITPHGLAMAWREHEASCAKLQAELDEFQYVKEWQVANAKIIDGLTILATGTEHYLPLAEEWQDRLEKYGTLTEKQLALAYNLIAKTPQYVNRDTYHALFNLAIFIRHHVRLGRYDGDLLSDISQKALTWGFTHGQASAIYKMRDRYRKQIAAISTDTKALWMIQ